MVKIVSRRGKEKQPTNEAEVDFELDLSTLEDEPKQDDDPPFEYYSEDWVIQGTFINEMNRRGAVVYRDPHRCLWTIEYRGTVIGKGLDVDFQSDIDTITQLMHDRMNFLDSKDDK